MPFTFSLAFSDTSLILLTSIIALTLYSRYFNTYTPLIHPLLLQRQSELSQTRKQGESAVYRNWATGHGSPLSASPAGNVKVVADVMASESAPDVTRFGQKITNQQLRETSTTILSNLSQLAPHLLSPTNLPSRPTHILSLLPPSLPLLQLHLTSSLTSQARLITLLNPIFLISALNSTEHTRPQIVFVQSDLLHGVLEQLVEDDSAARDDAGREEGWKTLVVVVPIKGAYGEIEGLRKRARGMGVEVIKFEELLEVDTSDDGEKVDKWEKPAPSHIHSLAYMPRGRDISNPHLVEITNQNITAGISSILSIFPASLRPALRTGDTINSSVNVNEPFGLGLMLGAIYAGAGFEYVEEGRGEDSMKGSTIAFVSRKDLITTLDKIQPYAQSSPLYSTAERQRLAGMDDGYLAKSGWMETLVWGRARKASGLGLDRLRALVVVDDSPDQDLSIKAQLLLSMPFTRLTTSKLSTGPIFVSHFNDLQVGGSIDQKMHTGAPGSNVEVLLKGDGVEVLETGGDPRGKVLIRGPPVLKDINMEMNDDGWTSLNKEATVRPNGTFVVA